MVLKLKIENIKEVNKMSGYRRSLPRWLWSSYWVTYKIIKESTGFWGSLYNIWMGDLDECTFLLRPVGKSKWLIYEYGSNHFKGASYAHKKGIIEGPTSSYDVALKAPSLMKRKTEIIN